MKKFIVCIIMMLCVACATNAQSVKRYGDTFTVITSGIDGSKETATKFTYKDKKGKEHQIFVGKSGACYIKKISKDSKEYKQYLGSEISSQVCKELGIKYTPRKK